MRENYLKKHYENRHTGENGKEERIVCKICGHKILKNSWPQHEKLHANKDFGKCEICQQEYRQLNAHIRKFHDATYTPKHACEYCGKRFGKSQKLVEHVAVRHTREFPYKCRVCDKRFRVQDNCRGHEKVSHPEEYKKFIPAHLREDDDESGCGSKEITVKSVEVAVANSKQGGEFQIINYENVIQQNVVGMELN